MVASPLHLLTLKTALVGTDEFYLVQSPYAPSDDRRTTLDSIGAYFNLVKDSTDILAQRRGTNAQITHGYRTFTDTSNYERWALQSGVGFFEWVAETAGTGTDNIDLRLTPAGTGSVTTAASFAASGGISGNTLVASDFVQVNRVLIRAGGANQRITSDTDGRLKLSNDANDDFSLLQWGGITAAFPAWKRSGTAFQPRLADDSGFAPLQLGATSVALQVGTHAAIASETVTGYITIKDSGGTDRKIAVIS